MFNLSGNHTKSQIISKRKSKDNTTSDYDKVYTIDQKFKDKLLDRPLNKYMEVHKTYHQSYIGQIREL